MATINHRDEEAEMDIKAIERLGMDWTLPSTNLAMVQSGLGLGDMGRRLALPTTNTALHEHYLGVCLLCRIECNENK